MGRRGSCLILLLILCFALFSFPTMGLGKTEPKTIVVPDDFATIQEAINNASTGDTVFVKSGVYTDLALINKSLSLVGENIATTIIDSVGIESRVYIEANYVTVTGFTIRNAASHGIRLGLNHFEPNSIYQPVGCRIVGNNLVNNHEGINVCGGAEHVISGNNITGSFSQGILLSASKSIISKNNITNSVMTGITVESCSDVIIKGNTIKGNGLSEESGVGGLYLRWDGPFYIYGNNITDNRAGIQFGEGCNNSSVHKNNIERNEFGVELRNFSLDNSSIGSGNLVYGNNFIDNSKQVHVNRECAENVDEDFAFSNGTDNVSWDNGTKGNYWSNYNGTDNNADGIGDISYIIDGNNQDNNPVMEPVATPKFQSQIMSLDEATLAVSIEVLGEFIGFRKIGELVGEPILHESGVTGYLMWLVSNGTVYQAEYPRGNILGEYLLTHRPYWNSSEGSYIWELNYGNTETYWVEATNGTLLQHTHSKEPLDLDEPTFQLSTESILSIALAITAITGATLILYRKYRKTTNKAE